MHLILVSAQLSITGRSVYANASLLQYINTKINPVLASPRDIYTRTVAAAVALVAEVEEAWKQEAAVSDECEEP